MESGEYGRISLTKHGPWYRAWNMVQGNPQREAPQLVSPPLWVTFHCYTNTVPTLQVSSQEPIAHLVICQYGNQNEPSSWTWVAAIYVGRQNSHSYLESGRPKRVNNNQCQTAMSEAQRRGVNESQSSGRLHGGRIASAQWPRNQWTYERQEIGV
jgi:hypothetical protein